MWCDGQPKFFRIGRPLLVQMKNLSGRLRFNTNCLVSVLFILLFGFHFLINIIFIVLVNRSSKHMIILAAALEMCHFSKTIQRTIPAVKHHFGPKPEGCGHLGATARQNSSGPFPVRMTGNFGIWRTKFRFHRKGATKHKKRRRRFPKSKYSTAERNMISLLKK